MLLFIALLCYIISLSIFVYKKSIYYCWRSTKDKKFIFLTMGILLLMNCLRGIDVGNDTISYKRLFEYYLNGQLQDNISLSGIRWMDNLDIGFRSITSLFGKFSSSYQLYISLIAIFLYVTISAFMYRESDNIVISVILFYLTFFHPYLNILRQAIAISIILIGFKKLKIKKYLVFSMYIMIATFFHRTAVVALIIVPLMRIKRVSLKRTVFILSIIMILTLTGGFNKFLDIIGYAGKYVSEETGLSTYAYIILSGMIFILITYWRGKELKIESIEELMNQGTDMDVFYSRMALLDLCLSIASINVPILYRCSYYFTIFNITGIPYFVMRSQRPRKMNRYSLNLLLILYIIHQIGILIWRPEWVSEFQYKFFWQ